MMKEFKVPLISSNGKGAVLWEAKNNSSSEFLPLKRHQFGRLYVCDSAKYQPYDALSQQFWRQYLGQYDTDDTGTLSHIELTSMLNALGPTPSAETANSSFPLRVKKPVEDKPTADGAVPCL